MLQRQAVSAPFLLVLTIVSESSIEGVDLFTFCGEGSGAVSVGAIVEGEGGNSCSHLLSAGR